MWLMKYRLSSTAIWSSPKFGECAAIAAKIYGHVSVRYVYGRSYMLYAHNEPYKLRACKGITLKVEHSAYPIMDVLKE